MGSTRSLTGNLACPTRGRPEVLRKSSYGYMLPALATVLNLMIMVVYCCCSSLKKFDCSKYSSVWCEWDYILYYVTWLINRD